MSRYLADENFPRPSILRLREAGYDVAAVIEETPGIADQEVLARAAQEQRILLTFDRDYGVLIYHLKSPTPGGVVYFRLTPATPEEPATLLLNLLAAHGLTLSGKFTVLQREQVRQRRLP